MSYVHPCNRDHSQTTSTRKRWSVVSIDRWTGGRDHIRLAIYGDHVDVTTQIGWRVPSEYTTTRRAVAEFIHFFRQRTSYSVTREHVVL